MQVVFFGTPDFAVPTLKALIAHKDITVLAAVSQPDRPSGRGQKLHAPPVKILCQQHNIPVFQPEKLSKAQEVFDSLRKVQPDLIVIVAFGQILKKEILALPKHGVINLHASLLPAYRGAAPINWAIINGDTATGITTMFTEAGLDTGPMLLKEEIPIDNEVNSEQLGNRLADLGARLTVKTIEQLKAGTLKPQAQDDDKATYAPLLNKAMGKINWSHPAKTIHNLVRGLIPWPLAFTSFRDNTIKIWRTTLINDDHLKQLQQVGSKPPGTIVILANQVFVCCGENSWLELNDIQPANKPKLAAHDWINGIHLQANESFVS